MVSNEKKLYAVIDIGTNSTRLLLAHAEGTQVQVIEKRVIVTRIGENISKTGKLSVEGMQRTGKALESYVAQARSAKADEVYIFATSAVREAKNKETILEFCRSHFWLNIDVLNEKQEARVAYLGAAPSTGEARVLDIGGGSTEVSVGRDGEVYLMGSARMGAVRAKETFEESERGMRELNKNLPKVEANYWTKQKDGTLRESKATARELFTQAKKSKAPLYAVGGTATTLCALSDGLSMRYDPRTVHGRTMTRGEVGLVAKELDQMGPEKRASIPLLQGRDDIIRFGAEVLMASMDGLGADSVIVSDSDNLEGYLAYQLGKKKTAEAEKNDEPSKEVPIELKHSQDYVMENDHIVVVQQSKHIRPDAQSIPDAPAGLVVEDFSATDTVDSSDHMDDDHNDGASPEALANIRNSLGGLLAGTNLFAPANSNTTSYASLFIQNDTKDSQDAVVSEQEQPQAQRGAEQDIPQSDALDEAIAFFMQDNGQNSDTQEDAETLERGRLVQEKSEEERLIVEKATKAEQEHLEKERLQREKERLEAERKQEEKRLAAQEAELSLTDGTSRVLLWPSDPNDSLEVRFADEFAPLSEEEKQNGVFNIGNGLQQRSVAAEAEAEAERQRHIEAEKKEQQRKKELREEEEVRRRKEIYEKEERLREEQVARAREKEEKLRAARLQAERKERERIAREANAKAEQEEMRRRENERRRLAHEAEEQARKEEQAKLNNVRSFAAANEEKKAEANARPSALVTGVGIDEALKNEQAALTEPKKEQTLPIVREEQLAVPVQSEASTAPEQEPITDELLSTTINEKESATIELPETSEKEPVAVELAVAPKQEAVTIELPAAAEKESAAIELPVVSEKEPATIGFPATSEKEITTIGLPTVSEQEPVAIGLPAASEKGPTTIELPTVSEKESAAIETSTKQAAMPKQEQENANDDAFLPAKGRRELAPTEFVIVPQSKMFSGKIKNETKPNAENDIATATIQNSKKVDFMAESEKLFASSIQSADTKAVDEHAVAEEGKGVNENIAAAESAAIEAELAQAEAKAETTAMETETVVAEEKSETSSNAEAAQKMPLMSAAARRVLSNLAADTNENAVQKAGAKDETNTPTVTAPAGVDAAKIEAQKEIKKHESTVLSENNVSAGDRMTADEPQALTPKRSEGRPASAGRNGGMFAGANAAQQVGDRMVSSDPSVSAQHATAESTARDRKSTASEPQRKAYVVPDEETQNGRLPTRRGFFGRFGKADAEPNDVVTDKKAERKREKERKAQAKAEAKAAKQRAKTALHDQTEGTNTDPNAAAAESAQAGTVPAATSVTNPQEAAMLNNRQTQQTEPTLAAAMQAASSEVQIDKAQEAAAKAIRPSKTNVERTVDGEIAANIAMPVTMKLPQEPMDVEKVEVVEDETGGATMEEEARMAWENFFMGDNPDAKK